MKSKVLVCFLSSVYIGGTLFAGGAKGNYYADANREIFLSPKSAALAGSDITVSRSALPLGNAASLPGDSMKEVSIAYAGYFQNTYSTGSISYINPVDEKSCLGISASYLLVPGIEMHDDTIVPTNIPTKTGSDVFFRISYGRELMRLGERLMISGGAAVNLERLNLVGWTGYGIGADAGITVCYDTKEWGEAVAGIVVENLTTNYTHWSSGYKEYAYPHVRIGLGWQKEMEYVYGRLSITYLSPDLFTNEGINAYGTETLYGYEQVETPEVKRVATNPLMLFLGGDGGAEYTILNTISFRGGVDMKNLAVTFGGGISLFSNRAGFDFAYLSHDLASTYKLSVHFKWR